MPNLYGVANAPGLPSYATTIGGVDVACNPNVYTAVITSAPLIAPSQGYFYAAVWACLDLSLGATIPAGLQLAVAIGAGSYANPVGYGTVGLAANAFLYVPFFLFSTTSQSAWQGAGSTITLGFQPSTNATTVKQYSSATICLLRAPDQ